MDVSVWKRHVGKYPRAKLEEGHKTGRVTKQAGSLRVDAALVGSPVEVGVIVISIDEVLEHVDCDFRRRDWRPRGLQFQNGPHCPLP